MPLDNTPSIEDRVLDMQAAGYLSHRIAVNLGIDVRKVRQIVKERGRPFGSLAAYRATKADNRPISRELVDALMRLPPRRCVYIEKHVHDPEARPCGEACRDADSAWCEHHHHVVYTTVWTQPIAAKLHGLRDLAVPLRSSRVERFRRK